MAAPLRVIQEFKREATLNLGQQVPVVPEPTRSAIASYLSYKHKVARNGVDVGKTSVQDIDAFAALHQFGKNLGSI